MTRRESRFLVTRTRLESRWKQRVLFHRNDSTRVTINDSRFESRVNCTKSLSLWWTNPVRLHTNKWAFFSLVMIKICANFLFWLPSRAVLPFKDHVSPTCTEIDLPETVFYWGTKSTSYCYFESFLYKFLKSNPKIVMQIRKPNLV